MGDDSAIGAPLSWVKGPLPFPDETALREGRQRSSLAGLDRAGGEPNGHQRYKHRTHCHPPRPGDAQRRFPTPQLAKRTLGAAF